MSTNEQQQTARISDGNMTTGEGMRLFPDVEACIDCGGCVVACKRTWDVGPDRERIDIVNMLEGQEADEGYNGRQSAALADGANPGETNVPMQCFHCENAPCISVCPTDALQKSDDGFVDLKESLCVGCQYCLSACPFGAPQFPKEDEGSAEIVGTGGTMEKCTGCKERQMADQGPACVDECATNALLVGTAGEIADELEKRDSQPFFNDEAMEIIFGKEDAQLFES
ncbi:4Fe-4S dicluster domain-containing protein [Halopiger aswanensis]|uniref:Formate dehydrogenase beta subunit n=1 Tax=Halopiger aswanensis TaxID=148449 RepID=A0A3R7GWC3_9EURY|nr:4Fe-4S dicluster domain-containing protein [Halopiger aswanensis]RKD95590.1 formate dehydrogenase beta subunit [Halopiger aswanensis]